MQKMHLNFSFTNEYATLLEFTPPPPPSVIARENKIKHTTVPYANSLRQTSLDHSKRWRPWGLLATLLDARQQIKWTGHRGVQLPRTLPPSAHILPANYAFARDIFTTFANFHNNASITITLLHYRPSRSNFLVSNPFQQTLQISQFSLKKRIIIPSIPIYMLDYFDNRSLLSKVQF